MAKRPLPATILGSALLFAMLGPNATAQREAFLEQALVRGIDYVTDEASTTFGAGMGFIDLNQDGAPDVVVVGSSSQQIGVYANDGTGHFTDQSRTMGIGAIPRASGVSAADYDADGDLDLYIAADQQPNHLLRNDGPFVFSDQSYSAGVDDVGRGQGCSWSDYDGDGWVDLYLANRDDEEGAIPNRLFRNLGDGTFEEVAGQLGVDALMDPLTFQSTFFDYDNDGLQDLYLCTDKGQGCVYTQNRLYRNVGGTFLDVTSKSGTQACIGCMGTAVGDFDGNGFFDFHCTNTNFGNVLFVNDGDGTYTEMGVPAGIRSFLYGWGTMMFDYNNDGRLDIFVCNSDGPNRLYEQTLPWPCTDVAPVLGVDDSGISYTTAVADLEGDGDLDILLQNYTENVQLFVNEEGTKRNWLQVRLVGREPNTSALGARVRIRAGGVTQLREVRTGVSFKSASTALLHIGLGAATEVDRVTVDWPYGARTVFEDVPVNRRITIREDWPEAFIEVH